MLTIRIRSYTYNLVHRLMCNSCWWRLSESHPFDWNSPRVSMWSPSKGITGTIFILYLLTLWLRCKWNPAQLKLLTFCLENRNLHLCYKMGICSISNEKRKAVCSYRLPQDHSSANNSLGIVSFLLFPVLRLLVRYTAGYVSPGGLCSAMTIIKYCNYNSWAGTPRAGIRSSL